MSHKRGSSDGPLQRGPFREGHHPDLCAWYVAYPLSYRQLEEMMQERGVVVDHSTINRWVLKYSPQLAAAFHRRKRLVSRSWRLDETYRYCWRTRGIGVN